jgi:hypothetical protein
VPVRRTAPYELLNSNDWADVEKFEVAAIEILKERLRETPVIV